MKALVPEYDLTVPKGLKGALEAVASGFTPFAGGTDLMVLFEAGLLPRGKYVSLWNLEELRGEETTEKAITLGALTTYSQIRRNPVMREEFPMLVEAAKLTGAIAIQNRGTLGGNIVNASPAADSPPALLVYEAGGTDLEGGLPVGSLQRISYGLQTDGAQEE